MQTSKTSISIAELARRSGVRASALRFYESIGLISSERTGGNHRRYRRSMLRRVAVIKVAQALGLSLEAISSALSSLPVDRTPSSDDWERLSSEWREDLDRRIQQLVKLREDLSSCIGCGCLSLESCSLFNREDRAAAKGAGPRYLMGDRPEPA